MEKVDAVILAAGRFAAPEAARAGGELKALIRIGTTTPLASAVAAMRARGIASIIVVGPKFAQEAAGRVDLWLDEQPSGEENLLAGLRAARSPRALVSASDMPFVQIEQIDDFLARVPDDADFAYPIYERDDFLSAYPGGRAKFARVGHAYWTGGSMCLMNVGLALRNAALIRRGFASRRSQLALVSLFGVEILIRYGVGRLAVEDVERRLGRLTGGKATAIRGAHAALAFDLDSALDVKYARAHYAKAKAMTRKEAL